MGFGVIGTATLLMWIHILNCLVVSGKGGGGGGGGGVGER